MPTTITPASNQIQAHHPIMPHPQSAICDVLLLVKPCLDDSEVILG
jgi:hypothetical protein